MAASNPESNSPRRFAKAWLVGLSLLLIVTLGGAAWWIAFGRQPATDAGEEVAQGKAPPSDPRLAYDGPFRNIHPDVKYVGDEKCIECHKEIHETYREHPMGRSVVPVAALAGEHPYDHEHNNPFTAFGIQFRVDQQGDRVFHRQTQLDGNGQPMYDFAHEVDYVVGSGERGHSYLSCRDGFVFQTPISWFSQKERWDISPGFARWACAGRLVTAECLHCHANRVEPVEGTRNRYHEPVFRGDAIGCERCHGPGELHAKSSQRADIVNPTRLDPALREAVCQQCHLEGATRVLRRGRELNDFRPGMPLEEFWTVYIRGAGQGSDGKAVNHVEQMYESLCFQRSPRSEMGCITCHDPHATVAPEQRVDHYRDACLMCHQKLGCSLPEAERREKESEDSCIACHMPRAGTSDIAHVAATDHRILRERGEEPQNRRGQRPKVPLLDFHRGGPDLNDVGQGRDLGVALYQMALRGMPLTDADAEFVVGLLDKALDDWPDDLDAWQAKGKILQIVKRPEGAIAAYEAVLERLPQHETALVTLGQIYRDLGRKEEAVEYWRRAVAVNPYVAEYQKNLVLLLAERQAWKELRPYCRAWLELDPGSVEARRTWIECLLAGRQMEEAKTEFAELLALVPAEREKLEAWFTKQMRSDAK